jgi:hypothetical protein
MQVALCAEEIALQERIEQIKRRNEEEISSLKAQQEVPMVIYSSVSKCNALLCLSSNNYDECASR